MLPMKRYVAVWIGLLLIVAIEVALAYAHLPIGTLVASLLGLALLEAGVGLWYFMHLKYERRILLWSIILLVGVLLMMNQLWPDALRLRVMRQ
ncbi:MAG: cytochrome C oxidase subunit IV family protein [Gemmatimonadota bacterium]